MAKKASKNAGKKASKLKGYDNVFAQRLRDLMENKHITQETLAAKAGCSRQSISQYMDGTSVPNVDKLLSIAEYFGVSTDYFLGLSDTPTNDKDLQFVCDYLGLTEKSCRLIHNLIDALVIRSSFNYLIEEEVFIELASRLDIFADHSKIKDCVGIGRAEKRKHYDKSQLELFYAQELLKDSFKEYVKDGETNGND